jgi:hypothetical protein
MKITGKINNNNTKKIIIEKNNTEKKDTLLRKIKKKEIRWKWSLLMKLDLKSFNGLYYHKPKNSFNPNKQKTVVNHNTIPINASTTNIIHSIIAGVDGNINFAGVGTKKDPHWRNKSVLDKSVHHIITHPKHVWSSLIIIPKESK